MKYIIQYHFSLILASMLGIMAFSSCVNEKEMPEPVIKGTGLSVSARIFEPAKTRTYQASGPVQSGTFYLLYKNLEDTESIGQVVFTDGTGAVSTSDNELLDWRQVGYNTGSTRVATFCMDNVPNEYSDPSNARMVTFTDSYSPFTASVFDDEEGTNDLLWGKNTVTRDTPIIEFDLHHNMSRLRLELTYEGYSDGPVNGLDVGNAKISISNIIQKPISYNRFTGDLELPTDIPDEEFNLVDPEENTLKWKSSTTNDENNSTVYLSQDFVFPPQFLPDGEERPRITVTVPVTGDEKGEPKVFSGVVPRAMEVIQPDGTILPMNLALMKEHILTLHVRLSPEPLSLTFMPVTVIDWVDVGTFLVGANQAGIYEESGFEDLIKALNDNDIETLERLGYKDINGRWVFNIFASVTLDYDAVYAKVTKSGQGEFSFNFHGWSVILKKGDEDIVIKATGSEDGYDNNEASKKLYNILTGNSD